ncbi:MAG: mechanosensitive ion channel family protein [Candidatus Marinimicrobia bacterium]|nr:mechanosensitive ion channel family protein [Candidatus Neomarinimicrobiota bacterium]MCF7829941.1 mechanosensitive ion channel family protein [Candidatus Neomarinimicrobiota bacterium]MCF7881905.1 mechanosensitive ion channel family protein [Candidatus Neomarinimicrobiota bacterium]
MQNLWNNIVQYFSEPDRVIGWLDTLLEVIVILVVARVGLKIVHKILERRLKPLESLPDTDPKKQRSKTMLPLLENIISYVIYGLAGVLAIQQLGVDITAILAGAGVVGLAIGFGAQSLVKDLISGFFLLFDGLVGVGDIITMEPHTGLVEKIGIRNTQIRKFNGELRTIPNGDLTSFGNLNRGFMRAIVRVGVAYEANIEDAMAVLRKIAQDYAGKHQDIVMEEPMVQGVMSFNASDVEVRIVIKVVPGNQWQAERDLRRMIKAYFDDRNVEIPFPRHVVYLRNESEWDNTVDTTDTPEEKVEELPDPDKFGEFGVDEEDIGKVYQEIRKFRKQFSGLSKKFRREQSSEEKKD